MKYQITGLCAVTISLVLPPILMTIKEQIIQELDRIPESYLENVLSFLYSLETPSGHEAGLSRKAEAIVQRGLNALSKPKRSASEIWVEFGSIRNRILDAIAITSY